MPSKKGKNNYTRKRHSGHFKKGNQLTGRKRGNEKPTESLENGSDPSVFETEENSIVDTSITYRQLIAEVKRMGDTDTDIPVYAHIRFTHRDVRFANDVTPIPFWPFQTVSELQLLTNPVSDNARTYFSNLTTGQFLCLGKTAMNFEAHDISVERSSCWSNILTSWVNHFSGQYVHCDALRALFTRRHKRFKEIQSRYNIRGCAKTKDVMVDYLNSVIVLPKCKVASSAPTKRQVVHETLPKPPTPTTSCENEIKKMVKRTPTRGSERRRNAMAVQLNMECVEEELSQAQKNAYAELQQQYNRAMSKISDAHALARSGKAVVTWHNDPKKPIPPPSAHLGTGPVNSTASSGLQATNLVQNSSYRQTTQQPAAQERSNSPDVIFVSQSPPKRQSMAPNSPAAVPRPQTPQDRSRPPQFNPAKRQMNQFMTSMNGNPIILQPINSSNQQFPSYARGATQQARMPPPKLVQMVPTPNDHGFGGTKRPIEDPLAANKRKRLESDESSSWVPLDEYYYGKMEGDPTYSEVKDEYRFKCWYCNKMLYNNIKAMMHIQGHIDSSKQQNIDLSDLCQCKHCYKQFDTPFEMQTHVEKVHMNNMNVLLCRICEKDHESRQALTNHMRQFHTSCEMPYICQLCNFRSSMYSDVVDHFKKKHDSSQYILCLYCLKTFNVKFVSQGWGTTQTYYGHLLKHQSKTATKKCSLCRLQFFNPNDVKAHKRKDHLPNQKGIGSNPRYSTPGQLMIKVPESGLQPKLKSLNAPAVSKILDFGGTQFPVSVHQLHCFECKMSMGTMDHYKKHIECSMCRYATSCSFAYANHMMGFHSGQMSSLNLNIPWERRMPTTMYCLCGFGSRYGNKIANHLVYCTKRSCYTIKPDSVTEDSTSDDEKDPRHKPGASLLDVLGLVKKRTIRPKTNESEGVRSRSTEEKELLWKPLTEPEKSVDKKEESDSIPPELKGHRKWSTVRITDPLQPSKASVFGVSQDSTSSNQGDEAKKIKNDEEGIPGSTKEDKYVKVKEEMIKDDEKKQEGNSGDFITFKKEENVKNELQNISSENSKVESDAERSTKNVQISCVNDKLQELVKSEPCDNSMETDENISQGSVSSDLRDNQETCNIGQGQLNDHQEAAKNVKDMEVDEDRLLENSGHIDDFECASNFVKDNENGKEFDKPVKSNESEADDTQKGQNREDCAGMEIDKDEKVDGDVSIELSNEPSEKSCDEDSSAQHFNAEDIVEGKLCDSTEHKQIEGESEKAKNEPSEEQNESTGNLPIDEYSENCEKEQSVQQGESTEEQENERVTDNVKNHEDCEIDKSHEVEDDTQMDTKDLVSGAEESLMSEKGDQNETCTLDQSIDAPSSRDHGVEEKEISPCSLECDQSVHSSGAESDTVSKGNVIIDNVITESTGPQVTTPSKCVSEKGDADTEVKKQVSSMDSVSDQVSQDSELSHKTDLESQPEEKPKKSDKSPHYSSSHRDSSSHDRSPMKSPSYHRDHHHDRSESSSHRDAGRNHSSDKYDSHRDRHYGKHRDYNNRDYHHGDRSYDRDRHHGRYDERKNHQHHGSDSRGYYDNRDHYDNRGNRDNYYHGGRRDNYGGPSRGHWGGRGGYRGYR